MRTKFKLLFYINCYVNRLTKAKFNELNLNLNLKNRTIDNSGI